MAIVGILFGLTLPGTLGAHELYTSYSRITINGQNISCSFVFDETDLRRKFALDENGDGEVNADELTQHLAQIKEYVNETVSVVAAGEEVILSNARATVELDTLGNVFAAVTVEQSLEHEPWSLTLTLEFFEDFSPRHKNLVNIQHGTETQQAILTVGYPQKTFSFTGADYPLLSQIGQFIWLGMEHIFIGYDHILFLLGLIVIGDSFKNLINMVTAFTVAHSITLALAALQVVLIPDRLVESVIALSIVYIAVENFLVENSDDRWIITFIFGLMHGFGFAGVLRELGLPTEGLVASLVSFNVGVEIGQIVILILVFPVIYYLARTKWQKQFVFALSSVILVFGGSWFIERAFGLDFPLI